jgi:uncharacterized protein (DUF3084 family)
MTAAHMPTLNSPKDEGFRVEKRMTTEQISEEMANVIAVHEDSLVRVAKAVDALSLNLAHHAAWTDERFDAINQRFEQIDQRFEQVDRRFEVVDQRFDQVVGELGRLTTNVDRLSTQMDRMAARMDEVLDFAIRDELKVRKKKAQ